MSARPSIKQLGFLRHEQAESVRSAMFHSENFYRILMDRQALWDPETIEKLLKDFPEGYIEEADLFLILTECIANAVLHGQADALGLHARERHSVILVSFYQVPPLLERVLIVLRMARNGQPRENAEDMPGGLGFPILLRLVHRITVSTDRTRLQLWLRVNKAVLP